MRRLAAIALLALGATGTAVPAEAADSGKAYCGNSGMVIALIECRCTANCTGSTTSAGLYKSGSWGFTLADPGRPATIAVYEQSIGSMDQSGVTAKKTCDRDASADQTVVYRSTGRCDVVTKRGNDWGW